ncbi:MAG TPA: cytochrome c [Thermoanaerobaculia bacterium]|nr:cytochrome c [Thermoanaerobaculia bacterium]
MDDYWRRRYWWLLAIAIGIPLLIAIWAALRFLPNRPVTYVNIEEHFKYGSTGGYAASGFPYWIWKALPVVFKDKLPKNGGAGYETFGMVFEKNADGTLKDLPVGVQKGHNMGIDRVFVNCAVCHHSTVRVGGETHLYLGMPAARFNLGDFEVFLCDLAIDERFNATNIVPEIERQAGSLSLVDKYVVYPIAISLMRDRLLMLRNRFLPMDPASWGPGRVDTFNSAKALFNFPFHDMEKTSPDELRGAADFPSIWNQKQREGMQLHWDGNNCRVDERNKSAAFGTGTTPATIDLDAIKRIEDWLLTKQPDPWPKEYWPIDTVKAARGEVLYKTYCLNCHGTNGKDFSAPCRVPEDIASKRCEQQGKDVPYGDCVGTVKALSAAGDPAPLNTDAYRLNSYTYELAANQGMLYAGEPYRFRHFRKTYGYANMPLDGIWLRAPYLHNGSVPTLRLLLEPSSPKAPAHRPQGFYRGNDNYDPVNVGFVWQVPASDGRRYFAYDTRLTANGNGGHEGPAYGTTLPANDKDALVEYLKTF